jgi:putative tryptophan/tyrosine transport system substrate-binding protein
MRRRDFVAAVLLTASPTRTEAQQATKVHKIGHLLVGIPTPAWAQLWDELRRLGYMEGHNLIVERRYAQTREQLAGAAADLLTWNLDVIVTGGTPAAVAAKQATATIPIIFSLGGNPVQRGFVESYERPGGNMTGFVEAIVPEKKLELLREAKPTMVRVACPCRAATQTTISAAARSLGFELQDLQVFQLHHLDMQQPEHFSEFVAAARSAGADGVLMPNLPGYGRFLPLVGELATRTGLPAVGFGRTFVQSGGLLSLGPKEGEAQIAVASIVHSILQGQNPADIPVVRQRGVTLALNLKTAAALGLTIPPTLLARADEVIE